MNTNTGFALIAGFGLLMFIAFVLTFPTMLLWNWLCPMLFGLPTLDFWQMLGFMALVRLILPTPATTSN